MSIFYKWKVNIKNFNPSIDEYNKLIDTIENNEKIRINKYLRESDKKVYLLYYQLTLCGRLMIRNALSSILKIPLSDLKLNRSKYGKPILVLQYYCILQENDLSKCDFKHLYFNISHHGDYVVFVCHSSKYFLYLKLEKLVLMYYVIVQLDNLYQNILN